MLHLNKFFSQQILFTELVKRAKDILKQFDDINHQWEMLQMWDDSTERMPHIKQERIVPTSSLVDMHDIKGRESEKQKLLEIIFTENTELCTVSVVPIVGMAGIGKTTLAQMIYNDPSILESFELRGWVFVGEVFDVKTLTKNILVSLTNEDCNLTELNEIQRRLKEVVNGKKFFVVIDHVWSDKPSLWGTLLTPLVSALSGRIVVTSRLSEVARIRQRTVHYPLESLPYQDCWNLFRQLAFENKDQLPDPNLLKIGSAIVQKCKGLPLAVKAIGSSLRFETDEETWKDFLSSELWESDLENSEIYAAMKLSYDRMDIYLKQFFVFLSLFPKGHIFLKDQMIRLWMSLGLTPALVPFGKQAGVKGSRVVDDLVRCSMIQYCEGMEGFVVHDIVHSLAESVAGEEFIRIDEQTSSKMKGQAMIIGEGILKCIQKKRYMSVMYTLANTIGLQTLSNSRKLRLLQLLGWNHHCSYLSIPNELFENLTHLRALDLSNTAINVLPESIGDLIQLRYLILTSTGVEKLPESICDLYNLQTLDLMRCPLKELPRGINKLTELRYLSFENTSFVCMPPGMGRLTRLITLPRFDIGKMSWHCDLGELEHLNDLRGHLCIGGLSNVNSVREVMKANIQLKEKIEVLRLDWLSKESVRCSHTRSNSLASGDQYFDNEDSKSSDKVLENLRPNKTIKVLHIDNYDGSVFSSWLADDSFTKLVKISLCHANCEKLPSLGELPSLKFLSVQFLRKVVSVGREFCHRNSASKGFPVLEFLEFKDMLRWMLWLKVQNDEFHSLITLRVIDCPVLRELPDPLSSSLTKLVIKDCDRLLRVPFLPSLRKLTLKGQLKEEIFSSLDLPSLVTMKVCKSNNIRSLKFNSQKLALLEVLVIHKFRNLQSISEFSGLESLKLFKISSCSKVRFSLSEGIPPTLRHLSISDCPKLAAWELFHKKKLMVQVLIYFFQCIIIIFLAKHLAITFTKN